MTRGRWIAASCVAAIVALYWLNFPTYSHRYRLTIAVEVDGQVHTGSSVIEARFHFWPQFVAKLSNGNQYAYDVTGQAVLVDLGTRGALVASLSSRLDPTAVSAQWLALRALDPQLNMPEGSYVVTRERLRELYKARERVDLAPDNLPQFIWFKDVADPTTARPVKSTDFAAVIGGDAHLAFAQLELSRDPVLVDIDRKIPWYKELERSQKDHVVMYRQDKFQLIYDMFVGG
jgi:hypothetical protein